MANKIIDVILSINNIDEQVNMTCSETCQL